MSTIPTMMTPQRRERRQSHYHQHQQFRSTPYDSMWGGPASTEHKPILADRFRTKLCRNYAQTGECPYFHRCMFAHGEQDLRTKADNVRDGLFSEDAIRTFKRDAFLRTVAAAEATPSEASDDLASSGAVTVSPVRPAYRHDPYATRSAWHPLGRSTVMSGPSTPRSL